MLEILTPTSCVQLTYSARNGYLQTDLFKSDGINVKYQEKISFTLQPQVCIYFKSLVSDLIKAYETGHPFNKEFSIKPYKDNNTAVKLGFSSGNNNSKQVVRLHISAVRMDKNGFQMLANIDKIYDIKAIESILGLWEHSLLLFDMFKLQDVINFRTANKNGNAQQRNNNTYQNRQQPPQQQTQTQEPPQTNDDFGFENGFDAPAFEDNKQDRSKTVFQKDMEKFKPDVKENGNGSTTSDAFDVPSPSQNGGDLDDILNAISSFQDFN